MNRKSALILAAAVCVHILHTLLGIPVEGLEQVLIASVQS